MQKNFFSRYSDLRFYAHRAYSSNLFPPFFLFLQEKIWVEPHVTPHNVEIWLINQLQAPLLYWTSGGQILH